MTGKSRQRLLEEFFRLINIARSEPKMAHLSEQARPFPNLARDCRLQRQIRHLIGALRVSKDFAQTASSNVGWPIAPAQIQHPGCRVLCVAVLAELEFRVGQQTVNRKIIRHSLVQHLSLLERGGILMFTQEDRNLYFLSLEIVRGQRQRSIDRLLSLSVERRIERLLGM